MAVIIASTTIENDHLLVRIPLNKDILPAIHKLIPAAKTIIAENAILLGVGDLVPINIPGSYNVKVGDIVNITFGYPIFPASTIKNIKIVISDITIASLISILQIPPIGLLGAGSIGAFIVIKQPGTIAINATPIDIHGHEISDRELNIALIIT